MRVLRKLLVVASAGLAAVATNAGAAGAATAPSGERVFGQSVVEPAFDAANAGKTIYLLTPMHAKTNANPKAWAPIYVPVYPVGSTAATTFNCQHTATSDNCPTHGNPIAGAAMSIMPSVYGRGVAGHDHVLDAPSGDDFNIAWEPVLVLFTSSTAANTRLLTDDQILTAKAEGKVVLIDDPAHTFNCSVVPAGIYDRAAPMS